MGSCEFRRLARSPVPEQSRERGEGDFEIGDELESDCLLLLADWCAALLFLVARRSERIARAREALSNIDVAEGAALERPRRSPDCCGRAPKQGKRMLQKRHQLWRRKVCLDCAKHQVEESAGNRARNGHASRVVDGEMIALELRRHAPRQS